MALNPRLQKLFDQTRPNYEIIKHPEAFTAEGVAQRTHVRGRHLAKVIIVRDAAGSYLMVVLPATEHVNLSALHHLTGRSGFALASEEEIARLFPDCEVGAMPPFGHLYGMSTVIDSCLTAEDIYFQAGNHHEVVRMNYEEFEGLARPTRHDGCVHRQAIAAG